MTASSSPTRYPDTSSPEFEPTHSSLLIPGLPPCYSTPLKGKLIHAAAGESFELLETNSIGRTRESAIAIADPRVSRRHALIRRQNDGFWFFDLGSSNGSLLNGRRVTTAQRLKDGDLIQIGNHQLRFQGGVPDGEAFDATHGDRTLVEVQARDAILLVSDIQGFTALSEKLAPEQLAPIIGTWYAETELALETHGANLDKFIGDCVLAYWLDTSPASRLAAVKTAVAMRQVCHRVNQTHQATLATLGLSFQTGAALHLGPTAYGAMSASEFTLLGDAVNLAFRLESLTRDLEKDILVSAEFLHTWEEGHSLCESCGPKEVKGRAEHVEVYSLERSPD